jgi:nucleoside-diphosphate-sugar epimerase
LSGQGFGRVLVTGASGFIGRRLSARLVALGSEVHAITRSSRTGTDGVRWWQADLADIDSTRAVVRAVRPEVFVHLASTVSGARDLGAVLPTFRNNLASTVNALVSLAETGCGRCVLAGSMEEPDLAHGQLAPSSPYAAAKHASAVYGRMFFDLYQLPVVTLRLYMVYGPGQGDTTKLIPYTITSLLAGSVPRFSSGVRPVDWIFVDDVVDGLVAAIRDRGPAGYNVDLGSGELVPVRDIVLEIARQMGRQEAVAFGGIADRPLEQVRRADLRPAAERLGWAPKVPLSEGLHRTIEHYRALHDRPGP